MVERAVLFFRYSVENFYKMVMTEARITIVSDDWAGGVLCSRVSKLSLKLINFLL
jgi:hypothetical protein